ncbi:TKL family protein kinase [Trichomonas vaginalis G3]|uniref:TKL family protein kinase n=1 Tax=Trichomonas vaginalis (strain ATCC PRA-98 / G3) TaxID=412133 RepID=A2FJY3_TRIV3|nr:protein kinase protein [Trichomonas vaginalis G3]EAX94779.1 TKL family protein kinase [Trichomonas vaginalis G3]KAI5518420.1 protein kinase protein [Trichomonas vaginalis G3]|eukprot:XP_001307709.1 TKL family protein kinase [Trichomonas vaginalis G3]
MQEKDFPKTLIDLVKALPQYVRDLNDFKMDKQIGKGGFGEVWRAIDSKTKEEVAVKKLFVTKLGRKNLLTFIREIYTNAVSKDKYCIKLVGFTVIRPYSIITTFAKGGCLVDYIFPGFSKFDTLSPTRLTIIAMMIAHGLSAVQQQNIVHRDVKPANILLNENKHPLVCDFGVARIVDTENFMTRRSGTIIYMAPELYNERDYDTQVDVYSYAIMLWEMSEKKHAYDGYNKQMMDGVLSEGTDRPRFSKKTPKKLRDLISQCWDKDPTKRPTFAKICKMFATGKYGFDGFKSEEVIKEGKKIKETAKSKDPKQYCNVDEVIRQIEEMKNIPQNDDDDEEPEFLDDEAIDYVDFLDPSNKYRPNPEPISRNLNNAGSVSPGTSNSKPDQRLLMAAPHPQFFTHLHQVANSLEPENFEVFFQYTSGYIAKPQNEIVTTHVQYAYCEAMMKNNDFIDFCEKKSLFVNLPTQTESIIKRSLDLFGLFFCFRPNLVTQNHIRYIRFFLENQPSSMIIILSHFLQNLTEFQNFVQLFDILLLVCQKFFDIEEADMYIISLMNILESFPDYSNQRIDCFKSIFYYFTNSKHPNVLAAAYSAIATLYEPSMPLDIDLMCRHAMNADVCPAIASIFIKIYNRLPITKELIHCVLCMAHLSTDASILPLLLADYNQDAAVLMVKDDSWYETGLPDALDTYRLLLVLWKNMTARSHLLVMEKFPNLLAFLASNSDNFIIGSFCIILSPKYLEKGLIDRLDKAGFFTNFSNTLLNIRDSNTIIAAAMMYENMAKVCCANGYPQLALSIITAASAVRECFRNAAVALTALTVHKNVSLFLRQQKQFSDFMNNLKIFPDCAKYIQIISNNMQ